MTAIWRKEAYTFNPVRVVSEYALIKIIVTMHSLVKALYRTEHLNVSTRGGDEIDYHAGA